jgi:hypothetical protein
MEKLTKETYKTNHDYMSYTRLTNFLKCEAAAAANYKEPQTESQLVGSYIDAYFSNELEEFKQEHPEIFNSKNGELKAKFQFANVLIKRIESDETFMKMLSGEKQTIMVGEIAGMPFKIKIDSYKKKSFIVDLKVMKDFERVWSKTLKKYTNFIEAYDYDIELAIFQEIESQNSDDHKKLPCYIAAITKEEPCGDVGAFSFPQRKLDEALDFVKRQIPRIQGILNGEIAPQRCEQCNYCKMTKRMRVVDWELVGASGDLLRENGYECEDPVLKKEKK